MSGKAWGWVVAGVVLLALILGLGWWGIRQHGDRRAREATSQAWAAAEQALQARERRVRDSVASGFARDSAALAAELRRWRQRPARLVIDTVRDTVPGSNVDTLPIPTAVVPLDSVVPAADYDRLARACSAVQVACSARVALLEGQLARRDTFPPPALQLPPAPPRARVSLLERVLWFGAGVVVGRL